MATTVGRQSGPSLPGGRPFWREPQRPVRLRAHLAYGSRARLRALTRIPARPQQSGLALRAGPRSGDAWFIVTAHPPYERGHNPAFWYDGERLLPLADYAELADFDVHLPTRRIAFVYWEGVQRHLAVKELLTK